MSAADPPYPPIDPTSFDLIVVGTGLPASVLAAAASAVGKSVLHLDHNPFYGSHFSSLPLDDLSSFLQSGHGGGRELPQWPGGGGCLPVDLISRSPYSHVEISAHSSEAEAEVDHLSRKFSIDLAGPRVLFCADSAVDLMLQSGAAQYMEFKSVDASFVPDSRADGRLWSVPDSRAAIFKDRSLALAEKNQLMRFFKLVQEHLASPEGNRISREDLESPFAQFLSKMRLPEKIKSAILYAIAMADYDQDNNNVCKLMLKTKDGIDRLALYNSSVGRFHNAPAAMIYPIYGQGELPQAFCRRAAVKGCLYVLRMPVTALLFDQESRQCKGIRLASGQDLLSQNLVLDPSFTVPLQLPSSSPDLMLERPGFKDSAAKVARAICLTRKSLRPDVSSFLLTYPPKSLYPEQVTSIRVLQINGSLAVCPPGMFVSYLSALCDDVAQGKKLLQAAMNTLFILPCSENSDTGSSVQTNSLEEVKPTLLWNAFYIQELTVLQEASESICFTPLPDGNLYFNDVLDTTKKLFHKMYPNEEFFPETTFSENSKDDGGLSLES